MIALFPDDPSWLVTLALALALVAACFALWAALEIYTWVLQLLGGEGIRLRWPRRHGVAVSTPAFHAGDSGSTPDAASPRVIPIDERRRQQLQAVATFSRKVH